VVSPGSEFEFILCFINASHNHNSRNHVSCAIHHSDKNEVVCFSPNSYLINLFTEKFNIYNLPYKDLALKIFNHVYLLLYYVSIMYKMVPFFFPDGVVDLELASIFSQSVAFPFGFF
jgi:hypothetical protein